MSSHKGPICARPMCKLEHLPECFDECGNREKHLGNTWTGWEVHTAVVKRKIPSLHTHRNLTSCPSSSCAPAVGELRSALQEHWQLPRQAGPAPPLCPFARSGAGGGVQVRVLSPVS